MRLIDADELKTAFPTCDNSKPVLVASVRATINHMPTIEPEPQWIPCSERLPEDGKLIYASFPYLQCCQVVEYSTYIRNAIDAWIPLPESYEGEEDG